MDNFDLYDVDVEDYDLDAELAELDLPEVPWTPDADSDPWLLDADY